MAIQIFIVPTDEQIKDLYDLMISLHLDPDPWDEFYRKHKKPMTAWLG